MVWHHRIQARIAIAAIAAAVLQAPTARGATPLNDLGAGYYLDQFQGGLYPGGSNGVPAAHAAEGVRRALAIQPLNQQGQPDPDGKYVLISIGMSNTQQEFTPFVTKAGAHADVEHDKLVIVNGAQGGKPARDWISPNAETYNQVRQRLGGAGVSESQVSAIWLKQANARPEASLPAADADAYQLVESLGEIVRAAKTRYPNLQVVFLSSRIYAGYATTMLNPEPYAYESGLAVKWLIEAQMNQMSGGGIDPRAGDLNYITGVAPWIAWGPYLWADGLNPRSDGLIWERADLVDDGTHPSTSGRNKVADMLMDFVLSSAFAQPWFLSREPGDFNDDGTVDAADYILWRRGLGSSFAPEHYDVWRAGIGTSAASGAASHATGAVPEPASLVLALLGVLLLMSAARRAHRERGCGWIR